MHCCIDQDDDGNTPLHLAIRKRRDRVTELLVNLPQVDIHIGDKRDFDMIQLTCYENNTQ